MTPSSQRHSQLTCFGFFCGFEIVTRTSVGPSHEEEKKKRVVGVMMCADLGKKRPAEGPTEATSLKTFVKTSL